MHVCFKTLNSDRPIMFEYRDQSNYVTRESIMNMLEVPKVTSVQYTHLLRASGPEIYNVLPLSIRNSRSYDSYQTVKLKYKHFLGPSNN